MLGGSGWYAAHWKGANLLALPYLQDWVAECHFCPGAVNHSDGRDWSGRFCLSHRAFPTRCAELPIAWAVLQ